MSRLRIGLLALLLHNAAVSAQPDLRIHGSNTIGERLAPALVEAWLRAEGFSGVEHRQTAFEEAEIVSRRAGERRVVEIHAHGSGTAVKDMIAGSADIGMASRPVTAAEVNEALATLGRLDSPEQEAVLALDGLAIIVHPGNPLAALKKTQVREIFAGRIADWSQLGGRRGRISLHARDDKSGTWDSFRSMVLGEAGLAATARRYESTAELAAAVAADPQAIGFVGLGGLNGVKALAISDGAVPLRPEAREVAVEDYPLSRRLYLYLPEGPSELAERLREYALSDAAQGIIEEIGFVSQRIEAYAASARPGLPPEYLRLTAGAQRLSLNFRFGEGAGFLDGKALRDLRRLQAYLGQAPNRGRDLILLGFADSYEALPYFALALSHDRVDFIADQLGLLGVAVDRARGFGGTAPVASNDEERGRQRNRRVEVWLR